ncbi:MAG: VOC family protein [Oceanospirillaceae bacterium]
MNQAVVLTTEFVAADVIRTRFSSAMSDMYRSEVPAYGALLDLVVEHNNQYLADNTELVDRLKQVENIDTLSDQRHGAIRLGKASELAMMGRIFAIMGMQPVGYYDLSVANVPVHSTAFRAVASASIRNNPFRVFTSLLRLELIENVSLRDKAQAVLAARDIFGDQVRDLVSAAEASGGLNEAQVDDFISAIVQIFRWHSEAAIDNKLYEELLSEHPLIADVVSFKGPHINHLTPRTLDIDWVQGQIHTTGAAAKAVIEGPPQRKCPILLRQTAFLAIKEEVSFIDSNNQKHTLTHAARFGEIEQRGCALTAKGRELYDTLLTQTRSLTRPLNDGSNLAQYQAEIEQVFSAFPDDYAQMQQQGLAYFKYSIGNVDSKATTDSSCATKELQQLVDEGIVRFDPITYEDFLPVSAAGIFQSNLGEQGEQDFSQNPNQEQFEKDLGMAVADEFALYQQMEDESIQQCLSQL